MKRKDIVQYLAYGVIIIAWILSAVFWPTILEAMAIIMAIVIFGVMIYAILRGLT